jgi:hypothetical protein
VLLVAELGELVAELGLQDLLQSLGEELQHLAHSELGRPPVRDRRDRGGDRDLAGRCRRRAAWMVSSASAAALQLELDLDLLGREVVDRARS